jgi:hypothetical protein
MQALSDLRKIHHTISIMEVGLHLNSTISAAFTLIENTVTPSGVIIANYRRAGKVRTGTIGS